MAKKYVVLDFCKQAKWRKWKMTYIGEFTTSLPTVNKFALFEFSVFDLRTEFNKLAGKWLISPYLLVKLVFYC